MDLALQSKLLRFLQEKTVQRVGEDHLLRSDARIICATNRDPLSEVAAGRFREDLFYRLHVVPVELPPLRDRDSDALLLGRHFLEIFSREDGKSFKGFTPEAEALLLAYPWPGNIRQLQNVIRSVVVLNQGETVTPDMLPRYLWTAADLSPPPVPFEARAAAPLAMAQASLAEPVSLKASPVSLAASASLADIQPLEDVIRQTVESAIERCGGSIPRAAAALQVSPSTIYRRIEAWREAEGK
jgi:two-component system repressor protein LuxO